MRLKSLKLAGFKSFANPTTFSFGKNITAIVGPNGCGKSNVIDAIRWVLGESSAKQLRGGAMSDVIFAGTQTSSAKSLASVELTFEHTQDEQTGIRHELNLYHELSVRRQVSKEGKSDYFINGTRCRRRDVVDIFLGTGLGSRSYAVIEQGMIGRIVDSTPMQLREFIEEGAGVSRYQARRLETQKRLNQAEENLSRLHDLRSELEKQQRTLSRQAETAKTYKELTKQLHKLEQDIAIHQLYSAKYAEQLQQKEHNALTEVVANMQAELGTHTAKLDKLAGRIAEQQWLKDDARDKYHDEQLKLQQAEHALTQHNTRIEQLAEKQNSYSQQEKESKAQIEELIGKHKTEVAQLANIAPQLAHLQTRKSEVQAKLQPLNRKWQDIHAQREELQNQQRTLEKQHALAEQANNRLASERQKWQNRQANWQQTWDKLVEQAESSELDLDSKINTLEMQLTEHKSKLASVLNQNEEVAANAEDEGHKFNLLKEQVNEASSSLQTLEKQHATLNSEYNTLHALVYPKKKAEKKENHQASNQHNNQHSNFQLTLPKLSDKIELTTTGQAHADSLDNWLAMWLDGLVGDGKNTDDWFQLLTQDKPKADNNVVLSSTNALPQSLPNAEAKGKLIPLTTLIKAPKLAIWQGAYLLNVDKNITPSPLSSNDGEGDGGRVKLTEVKTLTDTLPTGSFILTSTGWLVGQFGMIHLSKLSKNNGDSHFLRQREIQRTRLAELEDELTNLEDEIDDKQRTLKKSQANHDDLQITLQELTAQASNLQQQSHEYRQAITELTAKIDQQNSLKERQNADKQRLNQEKQQLEQDKTALDNEEKQLSQQLSTLEQQLPKINEQLAQVENERSQIRHERTETDNQSREIDGALQSITMQQQQLKMSVQHIEGQQSNLEKQLQRYSSEQSKIIADIEKLEEELPNLEQAVKAQKNICHEGQIKLDEYQGQLTELQTQHSAKREEHSTELEKVNKEQQRLAEVTTKLAIAKERLNEACSRVDSLANVKKHTTNKQSNKTNSTNPNNQSTAMLELTFVPARYRIVSQDYQSPYQHPWQMMLATGQNKLRFANSDELVKALTIAEFAETTDEESPNEESIDKKSTDKQTSQNEQQETGNANSKPKISSSTLLTEFILYGKFEPEKENAKQQARQQEYQTLQMKVGRMGAVNLVAVEELAEVNERLQPLNEQMEDIVDSIKKLTDAIKTIDEKTKELFMKTLESVNKDLLHLFKKVFGGGQASLTLIDDDNLAKADKWRAGLELMAQPKGKKNSRLAVLSGGEKTLTALSMIFAIFKQHPAPFCVLDEVDAPLDDANVGRFTGLIEELATDLQFIFISHNKLSMQIADELKGITMPTAGISSLVSVSLDEAERYIEPSE